jgi:hypothetical protein
MKRFVKILGISMFVLVICLTNSQAQGLKGVLKKAKGAVSNVGNKAVGSKSSSKSESPSAGPAKPMAPDVKNSISEIRAFTGLTKDAFTAKMKSLGFVEANDEMGMGGKVYQSKSKGYSLSVAFGTRGKSELVRAVSKGIANKSPNLGTIKTTFLDLGKQCTNLKAEYTGGSIKLISEKGGPKNMRNAADRTSKFLPAFDNMISTKADGMAVEGYSEKDYRYGLTYRYVKGMGSVLIIEVTDETIESQEG